MKTRVWCRTGALVAALLCSVAIPAQELTISAAASLTSAFQAVGKAYEQAHPGRKLIFNFAASGPLLAQIEQGAPVDVFASADQQTMDRAAKDNLLAEGTRANFARNTLAVIVPASALQTPSDLKALGGAGYQRIATGSPATVPVGRYTMDAVQLAGVAGVLEPRWIYGESVRQVLNYVTRAEVDAGFVYHTDALLEPKKTRIAFTAPTSTAVSYPMAVVAASKNAAAGKNFIAFVRGAEGQKILERFGFSQP